MDRQNLKMLPIVQPRSPEVMTTYMGIIIDVFEPTAQMFSIYDIAHALSNAPRFAGHTPINYTVAQHSIAVAKLVETYKGGIYSTWAIEALMHDASEAYMTDLPAPIKHKMPEFMAVENHLMKVLFDAFWLRYPYDPIVKEMDTVHVNMEMSKSFVFPRVTHEEIELNFLGEYTRLQNIRLSEKREYLRLSKY